MATMRLPTLAWLARIGLIVSTAMIVVVGLSYALAGVVAPALQLLYVHQFQQDGEDFAKLMLRDLRLNIDYPLIPDYPGWASEAAWSPDGTMIAFSRYAVVGGQRHIYIYDLSDGTQQRISDIDTSGNYNSPNWSPDGRYVAYHGTGARSLDVDLFRYDLQTRQQELLHTGDGADMMPTWSPDGKTILFLRNTGMEFVPRVYRLDVDTDKMSPLTGASITYFPPGWSPDGRELVVATYNGVTHGLDILTLADTELRVLLRRSRQQVTYSEPDWSPDGHWIAYVTFSEQGSQVLIIPAEGGSPISVTPSGATYRQPDWRPLGD